MKPEEFVERLMAEVLGPELEARGFLRETKTSWVRRTDADRLEQLILLATSAGAGGSITFRAEIGWVSAGKALKEIFRRSGITEFRKLVVRRHGVLGADFGMVTGERRPGGRTFRIDDDPRVLGREILGVADRCARDFFARFPTLESTLVCYTADLGAREPIASSHARDLDGAAVLLALGRRDEARRFLEVMAASHRALGDHAPAHRQAERLDRVRATL